MIDIDFKTIKRIESAYGSAFYIFNEEGFVNNYKELESVFRNVYPNYKICYSYKTNYTPAICKCVKGLGGYAEVVSDMEYELAEKIGYSPEKIVYNGPFKGSKLEYHLLNSGINNIDNIEEARLICDFKKKYRNKRIGTGIRVNFDVDAGYVSRFGIDINEFGEVVELLKENGVELDGIHCHISRARNIEAWKCRTETMLNLIEENKIENIKYISFGSGMYGHMDDELKEQFSGTIPSYEDYADCVLGRIKDYYKEKIYAPIVFTEPGTTLVSKYVDFLGRIIGIKTIRGKEFVVLNSSFHNLGETCQMKNLPIKIYREEKNEENDEYLNDANFVGYTCLEQDVLYKSYRGKIKVGDYVLFGNVGGYSIVDKPPFIQPNYPFVSINGNDVKLIKRKEVFDDIFSSFIF